MKSQQLLDADLVLYRELAADVLVQQRQAPQQAALFYAELSMRAAREGWQGDIYLNYLLDALVTADNVFSRAAARQPYGQLPPALLRIALAEIEALRALAALPLPGPTDWQELVQDFPFLPCNHHYGQAYEAALADLNAIFLTEQAQALLERLAAFHYRFGYGALVRYSFLSWDDGLIGVANADAVQLTDLFAYERQKQQVLANTAAFVAGKPANNLLLYGEKGTGKSSLVKAVANHFAAAGLRLLYLPRRYWSQLGRVLEELSAYRQRFIIYLDDLSFDAQEADYKQIKSVIEGGATAKPANLLLYATSNRRHLIAESWQDRGEREQDMYLPDTVSEKLALADRFGLTITFPPPSQEAYLEIVRGIADLEGLNLADETLAAEAIRWERWYNARSGRTARQFINDYLARQT